MTHLRIEFEDSLTIKDNCICACIGKQEYVYSLEQVEKIVLLTTDLGPLYDDMGLAIDVGNDIAIFVMSGHNCFQDFLFEQIGNALPIDYQKVIEASSCIERNVFEIYRKNR